MFIDRFNEWLDTGPILLCQQRRGPVDSERRVRQVFKNNPQGNRLRGRPKTDGRMMYKQILIYAKLLI